jgi:hypothetical protein
MVELALARIVLLNMLRALMIQGLLLLSGGHLEHSFHLLTHIFDCFAILLGLIHNFGVLSLPLVGKPIKDLLWGQTCLISNFNLLLTVKVWVTNKVDEMLLQNLCCSLVQRLRLYSVIMYFL